ncbi:MAG: hypothetical protein KGJ49_04110 [Alphaproteobacteria bacterium]|nr:hypothetical protein [Alphaproteobacteria bacterium]
MANVVPFVFPFSRRAGRLPASGAGSRSRVVVIGIVPFGAIVIGALALGVLSIGALAVTRMAMARLSTGKLRLKRAEIDKLASHRLNLLENANRASQV